MKKTHKSFLNINYMKILLFIFLFYLIIELFFYLFFPKFLKSNQFDEGDVIVKDKKLGWKQKKNINFKYYHRYNKNFISSCHFNNFGILDKKNYNSKKSQKIRVAIFGDTYFSGYDYGYNISFQKEIRSKITKINSNIELIFCFQRNYNTYQLLNFYKKYFFNFKFDHLIYIFNSNHPRRNITLHEAQKNKKITYPYFNYDNLKIIKEFKINHKDDLAYINEKNEVVYRRNKNSFYNNLISFIYDNFYIYSLMSDLFIGPNKLRNLKNISEIKKIEKKKKLNLKDYPYQWKITKNILLEWKKCLNKNNTKFHIVRNLINYQYDLNLTNHELASQSNKLPEVQYLKHISKKIGVNYYEYPQKDLKKGYYYIHPRYGYFNHQGIKYFSKLIVSKIFKIILK